MSTKENLENALEYCWHSPCRTPTNRGAISCTVTRTHNSHEPSTIQYCKHCLLHQGQWIGLAILTV